MQFYPKSVMGAEWHDDFVHRLVEWDEEEYGEFDVSDWAHRETFQELLYDNHGVDASIQEFEWVKGGYVQGLTGLSWDTTYLIVDRDCGYEDVLQEKLSVDFEVGSYSQLG